jgi:hypothetical protein
MVCKSDALPMAWGPHDWAHRPQPPTAAEVAQRLAPFYMYHLRNFSVATEILDWLRFTTFLRAGIRNEM